MTLKDKKFIPYYIMGATLIVLSIITVVLFTVVYKQPEQEPVQEPEITEEPTLFMNGEVPFYPDVAASTFDKNAFSLNDDGRMVYNDTNVKSTTGIDISSHQGSIDWQKVKEDGIDFAIIRIGLRGYGAAGNICEDDLALKNIKNAHEAGIKVGVYFFSQALNAEEAKEEAEFVLDLLNGCELEYPVFFDWENEPDINERTDGMTGEQMTECALSFCDTIKAAGYTPGIYFNLSFAYFKFDLSRLKQYPTWYAQHKGEQPNMYYSYDIWQYSDTGKVNGIDTAVDMNISFNDFGNKTTS